MAFCVACGSEHPAQARFCGGCGRPISVAVARRVQTSWRGGLSAPEVTPPANLTRKRAIALVVLAVVVVLVLIGSDSGDSGSSTSSKSADATAQAACTHFKNATHDLTSGLLTMPDYREKLKEVHRSASASDLRGLESAARGVLASITFSDTDQLETAARQMFRLCSDVPAFGG